MNHGERQREAGAVLAFYDKRPIPVSGPERVVYEFFKLAFPNKKMIDPNYFEEWVDRFKKGDPWVYMDTPRIKAYIELIVRHFKKGKYQD